MPAIAPGSKVLVTGANGFAAIHIVDILLKKGYSVRATIRSESKGTYLKKLFEKYGDKLELVIVPDITKVSLASGPREVGHRAERTEFLGCRFRWRSSRTRCCFAHRLSIPL